MKRKSASTLIYFTDQKRKKSLVKRPKHVNKEKRSKLIQGVAILIVVVFFGGLGSWVYFRYRPLDITRVEVIGAQRFVNPHDVKAMTEEKALGKNCLFFNTQALEKTILDNFLASKSVKVRCVLPKSVRVEVVERVPIALIQPQDKGSTEPAFHFVDKDGFVLGLADKSATNLPVINYRGPVGVGKFVEPAAVSYYFDLIKALDEDGIAVSTISSYPRYTEFSTKEDGKVLVTNAQSAKSQVKIFAKMLMAFKSEGKKVKQIDLRFDKVIVEFDNKADSIDLQDQEVLD